MTYCIDETTDEPIMLINSHIGNSAEDGQGVDGALFQKELLYLDSLGKKRIQVWINSVGGVVFDGYNIISAILKSKTPVDTYNVGMAVSIAGVIFMCGRNRVAMDYALFMAHSPQGGSDNEVLKLMQGSLSTVLSAKCDITPEEMSALMDKTTWMDAGEMKGQGLATEIETTDSKNKKRMLQATDKAAEANKITNLLITTKIKKSMLKVTNKLGLNDDASEANVLEAISQIENKAVAELKDVMDKSTSEKEALQCKIEEAENALADMKTQRDAFEKEVEEAKNAATDLAATNMVTEFAKVGRIKNEELTIGKWVNLAKADFEGTKSLIEELPLNAIANKIEVIDAVVAGSGEDMMAIGLKELQNKKTK